MYVWKLTAPGTLVREEQDNPAREEGKARVRVTKLFLNGTDAALFNGSIGIRYPLIPGRYAVGLIAEESGMSYLPKGTRVLLHAVTDAPVSGKRRRTISAICAYVPAQSTPSPATASPCRPTAALSAAALSGAPRRRESAESALSATAAQNGTNCMSVPSLSNSTARIKTTSPCRRTRRYSPLLRRRPFRRMSARRCAKSG